MALRTIKTGDGEQFVLNGVPQTDVEVTFKWVYQDASGNYQRIPALIDIDTNVYYTKPLRVRTDRNGALEVKLPDSASLVPKNKDGSTIEVSGGTASVFYQVVYCNERYCAQFIAQLADGTEDLTFYEFENVGVSLTPGAVTEVPISFVQLSDVDITALTVNKIFKVVDVAGTNKIQEVDYSFPALDLQLGYLGSALVAGTNGYSTDVQECLDDSDVNGVVIVHAGFTGTTLSIPHAVNVLFMPDAGSGNLTITNTSNAKSTIINLGSSVNITTLNMNGTTSANQVEFHGFNMTGLTIRTTLTPGKITFRDCQLIKISLLDVQTSNTPTIDIDWINCEAVEFDNEVVESSNNSSYTMNFGFYNFGILRTGTSRLVSATNDLATATNLNIVAFYGKETVVTSSQLQTFFSTDINTFAINIASATNSGHGAFERTSGRRIEADSSGDTFRKINLLRLSLDIANPEEIDYALDRLRSVDAPYDIEFFEAQTIGASATLTAALYINNTAVTGGSINATNTLQSTSPTAANSMDSAGDELEVRISSKAGTVERVRLFIYGRLS